MCIRDRFTTAQKEELCRYVAAVSCVTHTSDITIAGASMIAMAVASAMEHQNREKMIEDALSVTEYAMELGLSLIHIYRRRRTQEQLVFSV